MITVCLCDDNKIMLNKYKEELTNISKNENIQIKINCFLSGEQLLFYMEEEVEDVDIIYLDIEMGGINGIETAKKLRESGCKSEIIFLTSSEEYVFESFDVETMHYLIKDKVSSEKFIETFKRAAEITNNKKNEFFICEFNGVIKKIPIHLISHFEVFNRVIVVHYDNAKFAFYSTMDTLEKELQSKHFVRCHRSFLVSLKYIDVIDKGELTVRSGEKIPIGQSYVKKLKIAFSSLLADF